MEIPWVAICLGPYLPFEPLSQVLPFSFWVMDTIQNPK
jgi:hypothetical protein